MKIAAAQLTSAPADIPANIRRLATLAEQARDQGAELLVLCKRTDTRRTSRADGLHPR
ncbi:hypothetical protein ACFXA0_14760 [Streptomyces cyaneofuscatus]|uniref:hypothetical protein n=1 Tax=Streptomyces cyaneofuscatus TaxID=66883 RepID=UPI0036C3F97B